MNTIEYIAPEFRNDENAIQFAEILESTLSWTPDDFGAGYAWDAEIPSLEDMQAEADALEAHLQRMDNI